MVTQTLKDYLRGQRRALLGSWWQLATAPIAAVKGGFKEELCLGQQEVPKRLEPHDGLGPYNM